MVLSRAADPSDSQSLAVTVASFTVATLFAEVLMSICRFHVQVSSYTSLIVYRYCCIEKRDKFRRPLGLDFNGGMELIDFLEELSQIIWSACDIGPKDQYPWRLWSL